MPSRLPDPSRLERLVAALSAAYPETATSPSPVSVGRTAESSLGRAGAAAGAAAGARGVASPGELFGRPLETSAEPPGPGIRPGIELVRAPGRVNLIGDHTDYNDGFVLPVSIDLDCWIAFRRRPDGLVRLHSRQLERGGSFWIDRIEPRGGSAGRKAANTTTTTMTTRAKPNARPAGLPASEATGGQDWRATVRAGNAPWTELVEAVAWSLRESGLPLHGIDAIVDSTIPTDTGMGSSAALEMAAAMAFAGTDRLVAAPVLAALGQRAEREYLGLGQAGIVDQFASAAGREGRALLLDCRSLETKLVALPHGVQVVVCDTGTRIAPDHATLRERRVECARAVALLSERVVGLCSLRDLDAGILKRYRSRLPEAVARRAEHVVAENARVIDCADALASSDLDEIGRLFAESHASLRDRFDVGAANIETMIEAATAVPGVIGSRMTGPGLGGCTVHLVLEDAVPAFLATVPARYAALTGTEPRVFAFATADGAGKVAHA